MKYEQREQKLKEVWEDVVCRLAPATKALFWLMCRLDSMSGNDVQILIRSQELLHLAKGKHRIRDLGAAFEAVLGFPVDLSFSVDETLPINYCETPKKSAPTDEKKLTEGQAIALQQMLDFLNSNNQTFCLTGFAGTGKTFLTKLLLDYCLKKKLKFTLCAPTNKAAKVLTGLKQ